MKGAGKLIDDIREGHVSCEQAVAETLARIEATDSALNAFISVQAERALTRARAVDAMPAERRRALALAGLPIAVKDNICTHDVPTTCASRMLEHFVPPYDATVVEALEEAGAVIVGKTNLDEFAMGSSTEHSFRGTAHNPHDHDRITGGSSGGSAAAVAAGMVPAALGSDTGGSIRQPCSHCGAVGLKPTYGRVSRYGLVAFASSLDQIGPIAADVRDAGLLLSVIAVPDERDSTSARRRFVDDPGLYDGDVRGLKVGLAREYFGEGLSDEVRSCVEAAAAGLEERGATLVEVSLPSLQYAVSTYYIICTAEASSNLARYDGVKYGFRAGGHENDLTALYRATREEGFGEEVKRRIMLGTYALSSGYYDAYYLKAAKVRTLIRQDFERAFTSCDAVISPVAPTPAFRIGEKHDDPLEMYLTDIYTVSANLAGIPALSVPWGRPAGALPVGVQLMAGPWREDVLLKLGYAVQELRPDSAH
jgi:aspartyl-tRNA(Asn)/glutamyl-tRNA(Gln) amidotransferase subunit A